MKVALDATPLTEPTGGISRYTSELSRALAARFPENEYWLLSDQQFAHPAPELANLKCGAGPKNVIDRRWWLWGLQGQSRRLGIDVFHGTNFSVPYLPIRPSVLTLHDLSPWLNSKWHNSAERVRTRTPILLRLGLATLVITPTEAVRKQAIERFRLGPERVIAVPSAASDLFQPVSVKRPASPYLLFVGTLEPRKNIGLLIEVWRELRKEYAVDLVLAGRTRADFTEPTPEPGLHLLGPVPDAQLPGLYSGAVAVVYPSLYEGFGLPVVEAMQCGAAVFTSRDPAISETAGCAAVQLDAADPKAWVDALGAALQQPAWLEDLRRKSLVRAAEFSWTRTAGRTHEVYIEACRRFR